MLTGCLLFHFGCGARLDDKVVVKPKAEPIYQPKAEVSVCEALQHSSAYKNKMVTILGIYFFGVLRECNSKVIIENETWPSVIQPLISFGLKGDPDFETDTASLEDLDKLTLREAKAHKKEEIWAKISGKFLVAEVDPNLPYRWVKGFSKHGPIPAGLFVKQVLSIEIKPNPTYDYGEELVPHIQ